MFRRNLSIGSVPSVLAGGLAVAAIMGAAYASFELGVYNPRVVARGQVTIADKGARITAATREVEVGRGLFWQVEVAGSWRGCRRDCENALRKAVAE